MAFWLDDGLPGLLDFAGFYCVPESFIARRAVVQSIKPLLPVVLDESVDILWFGLRSLSLLPSVEPLQLGHCLDFFDFPFGMNFLEALLRICLKVCSLLYTFSVVTVNSKSFSEYFFKLTP